ncbi:amidohydrolase family protein [Streptomyces decoyicus]|uniref:amidohydrolase family protein n=1 Tax=Streptomyces decoyicus TaxID=249567 RepID=UPI0004A9E540|nr:amidohydrolase family protein [Streptomyces decoyicus]KOG50610.1 metal-dependent hydrolase [Streptomyces decoyicus]QZY15208.1 amidohydrolase family protein [Streptomyces decoyicus]
MIIDAHSHVHDPLDAHLSVLDDAGVDRTVLFPTRPHPERATDLASLRHEMSVLDRALAGRTDGGTYAIDDGYARAERELHEALAAHPDRFLGFGSVPLGRSAAETAAAVAHAVAGRGLHGIGELTPPPDQAALVEPVLRAARDHAGLPVVVHGYAPTTAADLRTLAGLAARYPRVPLVISQLAGTHWMEAIELARATPNIYLELSTAHIIFAVRLAVRELPTRTLFGSDAPYGDPLLSRATVERVTPPGEVRARVLGGNLAELLGLG